jgi:hypothetical protein
MDSSSRMATRFQKKNKISPVKIIKRNELVSHAAHSLTIVQVVFLANSNLNDVQL